MTTIADIQTPEGSNIDSRPIVKIALDRIQPDSKNRKDHDSKKIEDLADDIQRDGLLQPIVVRETHPPGHYLIIAGERRFLAHRHLGRAEISARVVDVASDLVAVRMRAAENLHRENLTALEEAAVLQELADGGMSQKEIAEFVGKGSQSTVANTLRLLDLPDPAKKLIERGELSRAHAVALCRFAAWPEVCVAIAEAAINDQYSAKDLEREMVPFHWMLEERRLAWVLSSYQGYKWTKAMAQNKHWFNLSHRFCCLDEESFKTTKASQDIEIQKAAKKEKERAASAASPEKADRAKVRAKNAAKRKEIEALLSAAMENLKRDDDLCMKVIIQAQIEGSFRKEEISAVAPKLGFKLPQKLARGLGNASDAWDSLGGKQLVRLVAAALVMGSGEYAQRYLLAPDELVTLAAKGTKSKAKK